MEGAAIGYQLSAIGWPIVEGVRVGRERWATRAQVKVGRGTGQSGESGAVSSRGARGVVAAADGVPHLVKEPRWWWWHGGPTSDGGSVVEGGSR